MCEECSRLTKRHQNDVIDVVLLSLLLALNIFRTFCSVFVDFEQVNVRWDSDLSSTLCKRSSPNFTFNTEQYFI